MLADGNLTKDGVPAMSITKTYAGTFFETYRRAARIMARCSRIEPRCDPFLHRTFEPNQYQYRMLRHEGALHG